MENEQFTTLVNTLLGNNLASSPTQARLMAEEMLGTSQKVQDSYKKEKYSYMVSNYAPKNEAMQTIAEHAGTVPQAQEELSTTTPTDEAKQQEQHSTHHEAIQELRERASNPQPVNVQVDFQTPQYDAREAIAKQATAPTTRQNEQESTNSQIASDSTPANDLHVTLPGVDTSQTLDTLTGATNTPQAFDAPTREKDDFLSVRTAAESEQTQSTTQPERLHANAQPQEAPFQQRETTTPQPTPTPSHQGLATGFPNQQQAQETPTEPAQNNQQQPAEQTAQEAPPQQEEPERKKGEWTPEERKLKEDCDLTKVFNFSGK